MPGWGNSSRGTPTSDVALAISIAEACYVVRAIGYWAFVVYSRSVISLPLHNKPGPCFLGYYLLSIWNNNAIWLHGFTGVTTSLLCLHQRLWRLSVDLFGISTFLKGAVSLSIIFPSTCPLVANWASQFNGCSEHLQNGSRYPFRTLSSASALKITSLDH